MQTLVKVDVVIPPTERSGSSVLASIYGTRVTENEGRIQGYLKHRASSNKR